MDISGIGSNFLNSITDTSSAEAKADEVKFKEILARTQNAEGADDEVLLAACEDFEAYYLNKVFSQMRQTIQRSDLIEQSHGRDIYEDMLYDEYSKNIAAGEGSGLKDMLYRQLKKS